MIYRISVSRTSGDWMHVDVSPRMNLAEFGDSIRLSFGQPEGRHHAFFMDNIAYSQADCYYEAGLFNGRSINERFNKNITNECLEGEDADECFEDEGDCDIDDGYVDEADEHKADVKDNNIRQFPKILDHTNNEVIKSTPLNNYFVEDLSSKKNYHDAFLTPTIDQYDAADLGASIELKPIRLTRDYMLGQLNLHVDKKFKYEYNMSSDDVYQCRVLKIIMGSCDDEHFEVVRES